MTMNWKRNLKNLIAYRDVLRDRISDIKYPTNASEDFHAQLIDIEEEIKQMLQKETSDEKQT